MLRVEEVVPGHSSERTLCKAVNLSTKTAFVCKILVNFWGLKVQVLEPPEWRGLGSDILQGLPEASGLRTGLRRDEGQADRRPGKAAAEVPAPPGQASGETCHLWPVRKKLSPQVPPCAAPPPRPPGGRRASHRGPCCQQFLSPPQTRFHGQRGFILEAALSETTAVLLRPLIHFHLLR